MAEVIIRNKAKKRLAKILEAAYTDYGQTTLNRFLSELEHIEHRLSIQPESYPLEYSLMGLKRKKLLSCLLVNNLLHLTFLLKLTINRIVCLNN